MYSSVILFFFLVVHSVDTALKLLVCTQVAECINDSLFGEVTALVTHPVRVDVVVEVDVTLECDVKVTDVLALFDADVGGLVKLCACGLHPVLHPLTEDGDGYCLGDDGHSGLLGLFEGVDLCFQ